VKTVFAIDQLVIVGDRGMISQKAIEAITLMDGAAAITVAGSATTMMAGMLARQA
jgi:hypothetical protein